MSRNRRMVRFIPSIVPASSSTSFTIDATSTGRENSKRRIASASPTSALSGRAIAFAARSARASATARTTAVVSAESRATPRASVSSSSSGTAKTRRGRLCAPLTGSGATSVRHTRPPLRDRRTSPRVHRRRRPPAGRKCREHGRTRLGEHGLPRRLVRSRAGPQHLRNVRVRDHPAIGARENDLGAGRDPLARKRRPDCPQGDIRADHRLPAACRASVTPTSRVVKNT